MKKIIITLLIVLNIKSFGQTNNLNQQIKGEWIASKLNNKNSIFKDIDRLLFFKPDSIDFDYSLFEKRFSSLPIQYFHNDFIDTTFLKKENITLCQFISNSDSRIVKSLIENMKNVTFCFLSNFSSINYLNIFSNGRLIQYKIEFDNHSINLENDNESLQYLKIESDTIINPEKVNTIGSDWNSLLLKDKPKSIKTKFFNVGSRENSALAFSEEIFDENGILTIKKRYTLLSSDQSVEKEILVYSKEKKKSIITSDEFNLCRLENKFVHCYVGKYLSSTLEKGNGLETEMYFNDKLAYKIIHTTSNGIITQSNFYDNNDSLKIKETHLFSSTGLIIQTTSSTTYPDSYIETRKIEFQYLEFDKNKNWTKRLNILSNRLETREIIYF